MNDYSAAVYRIIYRKELFEIHFLNSIYHFELFFFLIQKMILALVHHVRIMAFVRQHPIIVIMSVLVVLNMKENLAKVSLKFKRKEKKLFKF